MAKTKIFFPKILLLLKNIINISEVENRMVKLGNHPGKADLIWMSCSTYWEVKGLDVAPHLYRNSDYDIGYRWGMLSFLKALKNLYRLLNKFTFDSRKMTRGIQYLKVSEILHHLEKITLKLKMFLVP